jgi:hypothetical protein
MMVARAPAVAAVVAASMMTATWERESVSNSTLMAAPLQDASNHASSLRETGRQAAATESAEEEFAALERAGIISSSTLPLHMVGKKDGSWRPWGGDCHLNTIRVPDRYPLPNLMDLSANMNGCTVFSKIDLVKVFHQIPMAPEYHQKTAVIAPFRFV